MPVIKNIFLIIADDIDIIVKANKFMLLYTNDNKITIKKSYVIHLSQ